MLDGRNRYGTGKRGQEEAPVEVVRKGKVRRSLQRTEDWPWGWGLHWCLVGERGEEKVEGGTELLGGSGRKKLNRTRAALYSDQWWNRRKVGMGMMTILAGTS